MNNRLNIWEIWLIIQMDAIGWDENAEAMDSLGTSQAASIYLISLVLLAKTWIPAKT